MTDKEHSRILHLRCSLYNLRLNLKMDQVLNERKNYVYMYEYNAGMISAFSTAIELVEEMLKDLGK